MILENREQQARLVQLEKLARRVRLVLLDPTEPPDRRAILEKQARQVAQE